MTTKKRSKTKTVEEIAAELEADPAYRQMRAKKMAATKAALAAMHQSEAPLVRDLNDVGIDVGSVWDLVNTGTPYSRAIPILLDHLQRDYPPQVREGIARSLAVPDASWAWDLLFAIFMREPDAPGRPNVKWALACALSGAATDDVLDQLIKLVRNPAAGENRLALLSALARSKEPRARHVLVEMRADKQLSREIRILVGSRK